ncbi:MAG: hypothetical protein ACFCUG_02855 [Thiotrichales bacterium]
MNLDHPLIESVAIPLAAALLLTGLAWRFGRRGWAGVAVAPAVLLATLLIVNGWHWPALTGLHKLPWLIALLLALQVVALACTTPRTRQIWALATIAVVLSGLVWIGWPRLAHHAARTTVEIGAVLPAILIAIALLARTTGGITQVATAVVVAALGVAGMAFLAGSLALMQLGLAIAAATGGFALWNWPRPRFAFSPEFVWLMVSSLGLIVALVLWLTPIPRWAPTPLLLIATLPALVARLPLPARWSRTLLAPVLVALLAAPLIGLAVWLSTPAPVAESDLYYH